jgi:uncharacterized protein (TIGR02996 family)
MYEDLHFLRALFQQPHDDELRLVYADWLEDRGDPRAEYLRLEVELHRLATGHKSRKATLQRRLGKLQSQLDVNWVRQMWWARNLPQGARLDLVSLSEGKGLIEVRGQAETVLLVEGKPVALNWDDCRGSVGQYLVFTGHPCRSDYVRQLREFVAGNVDEGRPLADQIEPLLAVFAPGTYRLTYSPSTVEEAIAVVECSSQLIANRELVDYYPFGLRNLIGTQTRESLDADRVAFYRKQIRRGQRPIVLTTSAETPWCEFVIDGHHKLAAYTEQQVKPTILNIDRWTAPAISLKEGIGFLPGGHPGVAEYRRMKRGR